MSKQLARVGVLAVILLVSTGIIGASSFTTATLERNTSIDVVADGNGAIALSDETSGNIIYQKGSSPGQGEVTIDFSNAGSATGVNVNSTYELGDPNNPKTDAGINITNNDGVSHTVNLTYTLDNPSDDNDGTNETEFQVYDKSGSSVMTISEEGTGADASLPSGDSWIVIVIVDTTADGVDSNDDLSGTLNVTAT